MKKVSCFRCKKRFEPKKDNKLIGLVDTKDAWICDQCLVVEVEHIDFADDRGCVSNALRIPE